MYCINCGSELQEGQAFCPNCGASQAPKERKSVVQAVQGVAGGALEAVTDRVTAVYGTREKVDLKFGDFFSEVSKHHTAEEADEVFIAGTAKTTPPIQEAARSWRRPWFYSRVLLLLLAAFFVCAMMWAVFQNLVVLPGVLVLGSFAVPIATMVFFFEANVEQNISFREVLADFFIGGVMSLLVTLLLDEVFPSGVGELLPAMATGLIEEAAKLAVVAYLVFRRGRPMSILNCMLIGSAVGAGFAAFESAGYGLRFLLEMGYDTMMQTIIVRGMLAIGGHVAWAAVSGAGLSIASEGRQFQWADLLKPQFLALFAAPVVCHGIWDWMPIVQFAGIPYVDQALLILMIWIVILVLLRRGIAEVNALANESTASNEAPSAQTD